MPKNKLSNKERGDETKEYNRALRQKIVENKEDADRWLDCEVTGAIVGTNTVLEVDNIDGLKKVTYHGCAAIKVGDKISVMISPTKEISERPEFDETHGVWKKPSGVVLVSRDVQEEEVAVKIKLLNKNDKVLCVYV